MRLHTSTYAFIWSRMHEFISLVFSNTAFLLAVCSIFSMYTASDATLRTMKTDSVKSDFPSVYIYFTDYMLLWDRKKSLLSFCVIYFPSLDGASLFGLVWVSWGPIHSGCHLSETLFRPSYYHHRHFQGHSQNILLNYTIPNTKYDNNASIQSCVFRVPPSSTDNDPICLQKCPTREDGTVCEK